jgi:hypothetical protein
MADQEYEPDWKVTLRRLPAGLSSGDPDSIDTYEVICCKCSDDPARDYREVSAGLRQARGPYPLMAGVPVFLQHSPGPSRRAVGGGRPGPGHRLPGGA